MAFNQTKSSLSGFKVANKYVREDFPNKNLNNLDNSWNLNRETGNSHNYTDGKVGKVSEDIVDLLPKDPFGMDICTTVTAITELIESWNLNCETGNSHINTDGKVGKVSEDIVDLLPKDPFGMDICATVTAITELIEDFSLKNLGFGDGTKIFHTDLGYFDKYSTPPNTTYNCQGYTESYVDSIRGPPPDALSYALGFLGLKDLLTVESVCKSLRDDVLTDPLLWRNIHVDCSLSHKITDDHLLFLSKRAQGTLQSLSLVDCIYITDCGLKKVLESNPELTKLNVSGCPRLTIEGIIGNMRLLKSCGRPGIKYLRVARILGVTTQHFEELKFLLGIQNQKQQQSAKKPHFLQAGQLSLSLDDERQIDIEVCPRCQKVRQVYDCPAEGCKGKMHTLQACRACTTCISRCRSCGRCLSNCDYEETFAFDFVCLDCWSQFFNLPEGQTRMTRFHFFLYG